MDQWSGGWSVWGRTETVGTACLSVPSRSTVPCVSEGGGTGHVYQPGDLGRKSLRGSGPGLFGGLGLPGPLAPNLNVK